MFGITQCLDVYAHRTQDYLLKMYTDLDFVAHDLGTRVAPNFGTGTSQQPGGNHSVHMQVKYNLEMQAAKQVGRPLLHNAAVMSADRFVHALSPQCTKLLDKEWGTLVQAVQGLTHRRQSNAQHLYVNGDAF